MGFNQHTRGTWVNNMIYNVHLLVGKISEPGNGPFSLTGQPSACGTAREVGTFAHRLPADMVVINPKHRKHAEEIWQLPEGTIPDKIGLHAVAQSRALKDGKLKCYWTQTTNNMQAGPNINGEIYPGWRNPATFVVVSDVYPTVSALSADLILPCGDVDGEGRRLRQRRAAHPVLAPAGQGTGRVALRPVAVHGVLQALQGRGGLAGRADRQEARSTRARPCTTCSTPTARSTSSRMAELQEGQRTRHQELQQRRIRCLRLSTCRKACSRNTPSSAAATPTIWRCFDIYHKARGLRWPVVDGKETLWRFREGYDPYVKKGEGVKFYGHTDGKAVIFALPYQTRPRCRTRSSTCGCAPAACWNTGTPAR